MMFCFHRLARHTGIAFLALFVLCSVVFPPSLASSFVQAKATSTPKPASTAQPKSTTQNASFVKKFGSKYTMDVISRLDNYIRSKNIKNVLQPINCIADTLSAYFNNNNCLPNTPSPNKIVPGVSQKLRDIFDGLLHEAYSSTGGKCGVEKTTKKRGTIGGESCLLEIVGFITSNVSNWSKTSDIPALHGYIQKILQSKDVYKGTCPAKTVNEFLTNKLCSSTLSDNPENYSAAAALWRTIQHQTYYFTKGVCGYSAKAKNAGNKFMERGETLCGLTPNYQNLTASQLNETIPISSKVTLGTWNATLNCIASAIPVPACVAKIPDEAVRGLIQATYFSNPSNGSSLANSILARFAGFDQTEREKFLKVVAEYEELGKEKKTAITEADREKLRAKYAAPSIKRYHENKKTVETFISYSSQMGPVFVFHWITNNVVIAITKEKVAAGKLLLKEVVVSPGVSAKIAGASGVIISALLVCERFKPCNTNLNPLYNSDQITRNGEDWNWTKIQAIVIPVVIGFFCQATKNRSYIGCAKDLTSNIAFEFGILRKMSSKTCHTCPRDSNRTLQSVFMESTMALTAFGFIQNSFTNINKIDKIPGAIKTILTNICKFIGQECNPATIKEMAPNAARTNKRGAIIIALVTAIVAFTTAYNSTKEVMDLYASKISIKNCINSAPCAAALLRSSNDLRRDAIVGNLIRFASGVVEAEKKPQEKNFFAPILAFVNSAIMKIGSQQIKTLDSLNKELKTNHRNICDFYKIDSLPTNNKSAFVIQGTDFYPFRDGCVVVKHWQNSR